MDEMKTLIKQDKIYNVSLIFIMLFRLLGRELAPLVHSQKGDTSYSQLPEELSLIFSNMISTKIKCENNKHVTYQDTTDYYLTLMLKDTLEDSFHSYLRKRIVETECPLCDSKKVQCRKDPKV